MLWHDTALSVYIMGYKRMAHGALGLENEKHGGLHLLLPDGWSPVTCQGQWPSRCHTKAPSRWGVAFTGVSVPISVGHSSPYTVCSKSTCIVGDCQKSV